MEKRTIFWNVDTQYDFMRNDSDHQGTLYVPQAETIEKNLISLTELASEKRIKVINTQDWHTEDSAEISDKPDFDKTWPEHCMAYTKGAEFIDATKPGSAYVVESNAETYSTESVFRNRNIILRKDNNNVFNKTNGNSQVEKILEDINPDRVIVYGVATNFCVKDAVNELADKVNEIYVVSDAIKEIPNETYQKTLDKWDDLGIKLIDTKNIQTMLEVYK